MTYKLQQAMIMAAGLGKRMLPLTKNLPKPMIQIKGKSLIQHILEKLYNNNIRKIVINLHYLGNMLEQHVRSLPFFNEMDIIFSYEDELLESGGGIVKALHLFDNQPFYRINSDIYWEDDSFFQKMNESWEIDFDALLLTIKKEDFIGYDGKGDFNLVLNNQIKLSENQECIYAFSGIGVFSPKLFKDQEIKKFTLFGDFIFKDKKDSNNILKNIYGTNYEGKIFHIGTIENLSEAERILSK